MRKFNFVKTNVTNLWDVLYLRMPRKALSISVDLDIQAVTCPGVWLCPNGRVRLVVSMLGQVMKTRRLPPVFPLLIHEHYHFYKVFPSAGCLSEVQSLLSLHDVNAFLLQESDGEVSVELARFSCSLLHLLFPSPCSKGLLAGVDVDLLMEASADFPGILAPKIELSTRTTVEEVTDFSTSPEDHLDAYIINPKTVVSRARHTGTVSELSPYDQPAGDHKGSPSKKTRSRPAKAFEGSRRKPTPTLRRRATSLPRRIHTNPGDDGDAYQSADSLDDHCNVACPCVAGHTDSRCSLCTRYRAVFHDSDLPDDFHRTEATIKSRLCRCPDRDKCAFMRCRRSPRHIRHAAHAVRDGHWDSSPAAAALRFRSRTPNMTSSPIMTSGRYPVYRRSQGPGLHLDSGRGLATAASLQDGAAHSARGSLVTGGVPQSPAAALHARVERLLQSEVDPDVHNWNIFGRSRKSPRRGPARRGPARRRHNSLTSSDDSVISPSSPSPPRLHHLSPRSFPRVDPKYDTRKTIQFDETPQYADEIGKKPHQFCGLDSCHDCPSKPAHLNTAFGRVFRSIPCSCSNANGSHHSIPVPVPVQLQTEKQRSLPDVLSLKSCSEGRGGQELANDGVEAENTSLEHSQQGDRRIAFYSNLERYYHRLYMRARQRAARVTSA